MISFDYLGHFRGGGLILKLFILFEALFLSYRTNKLQKDNFDQFSGHLNSTKLFVCIFYLL